MQIFGENKKRNIILIGVIIAALGGTIYFGFFYGRSEPAPNAIPGAGGLAAPSAARQSRVLPYGATLNLGILRQEAFRVLKPFPKVEILLEELGQPNPFVN